VSSGVPTGSVPRDLRASRQFRQGTSGLRSHAQPAHFEQA
jgi:hypothetical protein